MNYIKTHHTHLLTEQNVILKKDRSLNFQQPKKKKKGKKKLNLNMRLPEFLENNLIKYI